MVALAVLEASGLLLGGWVSSNYAALGVSGLAASALGGADLRDLDFGDAFHLTARAGHGTWTGELLGHKPPWWQSHWTHRMFALVVVAVVELGRDPEPTGTIAETAGACADRASC